ncbi:conjugative transposon protein TraM [Mucilaginibacter sp. SMC90]|uniref:conjugative transposon protein TraM n=1 Tax=Mucilaginibacter sp. SMC90 TaxID=2929803 RepID=UPI001FB2410F|nr:conjugative transposon protein TraM [Mucilaginibacter sp. SMC90]UOE48737.1 conjugative transposon protein TraM [Mucilaginibacter sp. SMC90]
MKKQQQKAAKPQHSNEFLKKRRFLMVLPLLVLPFTTMAFWALGGGKSAKSSSPVAEQKGIDMALPSAQFKEDKAKDKMGIYQSATRDSDQSADGISQSFVERMGFGSQNNIPKEKQAANPAKPYTADQQSAKIEARLSQLNRQLNQAQPAAIAPSYSPEHAEAVKNVEQIQKMVNSMHADNSPDPEIQQLSKLMEQLQTLQNSQRPETSPGKSNPLKTDSATQPFRAVPAIIDGKQKVADGGAVKLKLTDMLTVKNQVLPKGQELFGVCQITNQRLLLTIRNIRLDKQILPVNLIVFSLDGMPGIPAPEAEISGPAISAGDNAIQSMQFLSADQSIGAQAAAGGVNAAKSIFSKKARKIKVRLSDAYPVLLKINP